jgi:hypothetical protein
MFTNILSKVCAVLCILFTFTSVASPSISPTQQPTTDNPTTSPSMRMTAAPTSLSLIQYSTCNGTSPHAVGWGGPVTKEVCEQKCVDKISCLVTGCCHWKRTNNATETGYCGLKVDVVQFEPSTIITGTVDQFSSMRYPTPCVP